MNGGQRWGELVRIEGWLCAYYWGGTAYCLPCKDAAHADRVLARLSEGLNNYDCGDPRHERAFVRFCEEQGWSFLHYYGRMRTVVEGKLVYLQSKNAA